MDLYTILTLLNCITFFTSLIVWRYIWFYINYIGYAACVDIYLKKNRSDIAPADIKMYMEAWPFQSIIWRVWSWKLKSFMSYPELYDDVMLFIREEDKKDHANNA